MQGLIDIFQTEHFSAVKFDMGCVKNELSSDTKISKRVENKNGLL